MSKVIQIGVYGGAVQWIRNIPDGTEIRVQDYDIDGVDTGIVSADSDGNPCVITTYKGYSGNTCSRILP